MARGDHIKVWRGLYWHHGIDMGDGTVVHATGEPGRRKLGARVRRTAMAEFLRRGLPVSVVCADALPADVVAARAEVSLGAGRYSLLWNNCEHFARWCHSGQSASAQVDRAAWMGAAAGLVLRFGVAVAKRRGPVLIRSLPLVGPVSTSLGLLSLSVAAVSALVSRSGVVTGAAEAAREQTDALP